jgi:hypothetical protein
VQDFPLLLQYGKADPILPIAEVRRMFEGLRRSYTDPEKLALIDYYLLLFFGPLRLCVE